MSLPNFVAVQGNVARIKQYLQYLGSHEVTKAIPNLKAVSFFPELAEHLATVQETVKADLRAVCRWSSVISESQRLQFGPSTERTNSSRGR
jgi:hypothetical protein